MKITTRGQSDKLFFPRPENRVPPKNALEEQLDQDARDLEKMGYVQELLRGMGGFSSFAVSFSVISILTGAIQLYGYGLQHGGPLQMSLGWLVVSFFTMAVALSMAELASAYPTAGALYHWASFLGGRELGWFTACFNTIGQFAILAGIDWGLAGFLIGLCGWEPTRTLTLSVFAALLFSHAVLNHLGIRVVSWLNDFSAWYHMAVVLLILIVLGAKGFAQPVSFLFKFSKADPYSARYSFVIGLLLAQWTLTGYDASAHVSEETRDPRRTAPWGIFIAVAVSVVFGFLMLAAITLSIPDLAQATAFGDDALAGILKLRLGAGMGTGLVGLICGAMWLCGLASMTSASRMVYAFARDGGLPGHTLWAAISPRFRTPANAIWGLFAFALLIAASVKEYSAVLSIAVIALYLSYGLPIAARLYSRLRGREGEIGPWNLGRFSGPVTTVAVLWIVSICVVFVMPPNQQAGEMLAGVVAVLAVVWFGWSRARFAGPKYHL
ncbi:MAG: amino acid permease [Elusimicrobia bacterium]|nr:amino acid permease [Elusimicrobiota bacterium]